MRQQWFTHVRLLVAHLTRSCRAFSATLTTPALDRRSLRWFGLSACTASPKGQSSSLAQHGSCWRPTPSPSLPFQDTPRLNSPARTYRYRRFATVLTDADARLAATVDRYSFGVGLSHSHLNAGLSRRT